MNRLVWFRYDLRVSDNETLVEAIKNASGSIYFVYVYDPKWEELTPEGYPRFGNFKKKYLAQSLIDLKKKLQALGADLICISGDPKTLIPALCQELDVNHLYCSQLNSFEEHRDEIEIEQRLEKTEIHLFETQTLFCRSDLKDFNFDVPASFSKLRKAAERHWSVRPPLKAPTNIPQAGPTTRSSWNFEELLGLPVPDRGIVLEGGESAALKEAHTFIWQHDALRKYKQTRNGLIRHRDSSKFSAPLALGCFSSRQLYVEVRRYEKERIANLSTLWFLYELLWRDHFQFAALRRGPHLFTDKPRGESKGLSQKEETAAFEAWRLGQTKSSFVNAAMIELSTTGWMSNRMRQNAASYLVHDLKVRWQKGARWFESCLVDYDPCSNWGNWAYIAGAGTENSPHIFDVEQQRETFDADRSFEKLWLNH